MKLIQVEDREGIVDVIIKLVVEKQVLERLRFKVFMYGKDLFLMEGIEGYVKINVDVVVFMYKDFVILLMKEVEVEYLMQ